jgi:hypothetical protein
MVQRCADWVVSVQLSWGDYVIGLRDLRADERAPWSELGGRELVRFIRGEPWLHAPSSDDDSSWQPLLAGSQHSFQLDELCVRVWGWRLRRAPKTSRLAQRFAFGLALAAAAATSPVSDPRDPVEIPALAGRGPAAPRASFGSPVIEHYSYVVRLASEKQRQQLALAGSTRCGPAEMGDPSSSVEDARYGVAGQPDNPDPHLSQAPVGAAPTTRAFAGHFPSIERDHARNGQSAAPSAPWGREHSAGRDEHDENGRIYGDALGAGHGALGLGLAHDSGGIAKGVELRAGGSAAGRRVVQPGVTVRGPRRTSEIGRALQPHFAGLQSCVERAVDAERDVRIELRLRIDAAGSVELTSLEASTPSNPGLGSCLGKELEGARFSATSGGVTEVEYPLVALRDSTEPTASPVSSPRRAPPPCAVAHPCSVGSK